MMNNSTNIISRTEKDMLYKVIFTFLFCVIYIIGVGGNICICWILIKDINRNATNIFLFNLSLADMLMCFICVPITLISDVLLIYWPFGKFVCRVAPFIQGISVFLSAFTHVVISFDRFFVVFFPMKQRLTNNCSWRLIGTTWIMAIIPSFPLVIVNDTNKYSDGYEYCEEKWSDIQYEIIYSIVVMIFQYFLPVAVIIGTYVAIAIKLWFRKTPGQADSGRDEYLNKSKKRMVKMVIIVASFYALSQLPRHVMMIMSSITQGFFTSILMRELFIVCHISSMSSSNYNFFLYLWLNRHFRERFRKLFCKQIILRYQS